MAQIHVETLKRLRFKMVEQRRALAARQVGSAHTESVENMTRLQEAIEAADRAIADEERLSAEAHRGAA